MATIGYARVSTQDQSLEVQLEELAAAGCDQIFAEKLSGMQEDRPELAAALAVLRPGDTLVVHRLDRLGRSLPHLVQLLAELPGRGITLRSLADGLDSSTPAGRLVLSIMASLAEFEHALRADRQAAGIAKAKARGAYTGRRRALTSAQEAEVRAQLASGRSTGELALLWGVSRSTIKRIRVRS